MYVCLAYLPRWTQSHPMLWVLVKSKTHLIFCILLGVQILTLWLLCFNDIQTSRIVSLSNKACLLCRQWMVKKNISSFVGIFVSLSFLSFLHPLVFVCSFNWVSVSSFHICSDKRWRRKVACVHKKKNQKITNVANIIYVSSIILCLHIGYK